MNINFKSLLTLLLVTVFGLGCKKENAISKIDQVVLPSEFANIKFFNFAASGTSTAPVSVNFFNGDKKVSAVLSATGAESPTGILYGTVYPASAYTYIPGGNHTFISQIPDRAVNGGTKTSELNVNLDNGKFYSLYTSGIYDFTNKTSESFMVEDVLPAMDQEKVYLRFVNAISNGTAPMTLIAKNSDNVEFVIAQSIAYKNASSFVAIPEGAYDLFVRYGNGSENVILRNSSTNGAVALQKGRTYTISSRGDMTITAAANTNRPLLDNTANR